jgi:hypothetical protein
MKKSSTTMTIEGIELDVWFFYTKGTPGVYHLAPENCYPEEPADVEIESVYLDHIDIFNLISDDVCTKIEKYILDNAGE